MITSLFPSARTISDGTVKVIDGAGCTMYSFIRILTAFFLFTFAQLSFGQTKIISGQAYNGNAAQYLDGTGVFSSPAGSTAYFTWNTSASASISATVNNAYVLTHSSLQTVTLPTTAAVGDRIKLVGVGSGKWRAAQNASELTRFGNGLATTTGTGGYLQSQEQNACIELVCIVANDEWQVESSAGCIYTDGSVDINPSSKFTKYTADATWTKDARTKSVGLIVIGGGGSGGSGRKGAASTNRGGGGGASGGAVTIIDRIPATYLSATEDVVVGASVTGGTSQTTNSTNGNAGTAGNSSYFGSSSTGIVAAGGSLGGAGTTSGGSAGSAPIHFNYIVLYLSALGGAAGGTGTGSTAGNNSYSPSGGGGGGGINSSNTRGDGGSGGHVNNSVNQNLAVRGTNGSGDGGAGGNGNDATTGNDVIFGGSGGGGGAASLLTNAGAGGNGGIPGGGGGGGGASLNDTGNSGAGGSGARGEVWVFEYF